MFKNNRVIGLISILALMGCGKGKRFPGQSPETSHRAQGAVVAEWIQDTSVGPTHLVVYEGAAPESVIQSSTIVGTLTYVLQKHHPHLEGHELNPGSENSYPSETPQVYTRSDSKDGEVHLEAYVSTAFADQIRHPRSNVLNKSFPMYQKYCSKVSLNDPAQGPKIFSNDFYSWSDFECSTSECWPVGMQSSWSNEGKKNTFSIYMSHQDAFHCDLSNYAEVGLIAETDFEKIDALSFRIIAGIEWAIFSTKKIYRFSETKIDFIPN